MKREGRLDARQPSLFLKLDDAAAKTQRALALLFEHAESADFRVEAWNAGVTPQRLCPTPDVMPQQLPQLGRSPCSRAEKAKGIRPSEVVPWARNSEHPKSQRCYAC